jgi:hypothetical protein
MPVISCPRNFMLGKEVKLIHKTLMLMEEFFRRECGTNGCRPDCTSCGYHTYGSSCINPKNPINQEVGDGSDADDAEWLDFESTGDDSGD